MAELKSKRRAKVAQWMKRTRVSAVLCFRSLPSDGRRKMAAAERSNIADDPLALAFCSRRLGAIKHTLIHGREKCARGWAKSAPKRHLCVNREMSTLMCSHSEQVNHINIDFLRSLSLSLALFFAAPLRSRSPIIHSFILIYVPRTRASFTFGLHGRSHCVNGTKCAYRSQRSSATGPLKPLRRPAFFPFRLFRPRRCVLSKWKLVVLRLLAIHLVRERCDFWPLRS